MTHDPLPDPHAMHDVYERGPAGLWVGKDAMAGTVDEPRPARTEVRRVPCPSCGNLNRRARRACKMCGRSGWVTKSVPTAEAQAHDMVGREMARARRELEADDGLG
jgi:hypothetical protein